VTIAASKLKRTAAPRAPGAVNPKVTKKWTMANGQKIRICDMTDTHLVNAIKMCEREHERAKATLLFPSFITGEEASWLAEQDYENFLASGPEESFPLYEDLCEEAYRRGLEWLEDGKRKL
jgi:phosphoribosylamine-glycine ligase